MTLITMPDRKLISMAEWVREREQQVPQSDAVKAARAAKMMDGAFYLDSRAPFIAVDVPAVTLAATAKALYTTDYFPVLGGNYFNFPGKAILIRLFGRVTTAATPGNGSFDVYWGTGADATGNILASSAALALSINQTNVSWWAEITVRCRAVSTGAINTGSLFCTGYTGFNVGVLASTLQPMLIPASAPAAVGSLNLVTASIVSVQFKRSGSTVETMQVHEMAVVALN